MRADLPINKFKASLRIGDLLSKTCSKLPQQITMFATRSLSVHVQLTKFTRQQRLPLCLESRNIPLSMPNLPRNAQKLSTLVLAGDQSVNLAMIVQQTLQRLRVSPAVRLIRPRHQQSKVSPFVVIAREVRMNALGHIPKERLQTRWRIELFRLVRLAERSIMCLLCPSPRLLGSVAGRIGVIQIHLALSNARLHLVQLRIEHSNLA